MNARSPSFELRQFHAGLVFTRTSVARQQEGESWELRAAEHGAALARSGQAEEARDLLAPVYGWFTEGFDTRDLKEAKVLLNEVAS